MSNSFSRILIIIIFSCSCTNKPATNKLVARDSPADTIPYKGLQGTWVRIGKYGFTLIEIKDTSHILYYQVADRKEDIDTIQSDRYWYYKSNATMGYWDSTYIWIDTDKFRFDYKLKGDTLIEFDKMGDQGHFIRVYPDKEKGL